MQNFKLPSALTIETVEAILGDLRNIPLGAEGVAVDAGTVDSITTPGVQLILALNKSVAQMGGKMKITQPSAVFSQTFQALGLGEQLSEWSKIDG